MAAGKMYSIWVSLFVTSACMCGGEGSQTCVVISAEGAKQGRNPPTGSWEQWCGPTSEHVLMYQQALRVNQFCLIPKLLVGCQ
jgi:hypothetical protein